MKKTALFLLVALLALSAVSCGDSGTGGDTTAGGGTTVAGDTTAADTTVAGDTTATGDTTAIEDTTVAPEKENSTTSVTDYMWSAKDTSSITILSFDGTNAEFTKVGGEAPFSDTGAFTMTADTIKVGDSEYTYKVIGNFININKGEDFSTRLSKVADDAKDTVKARVALQTSKWSGDEGASLSFDATANTVTAKFGKVDIQGSFTIVDNKLTAVNDARENAANLALEHPIEATSVEDGTEFLATNANDDDITTRWASGYVDPQYLTVDLEKEQSISAVTITWEAAYGTKYNIQTSSDNTTWTTVVTVEDGAEGEITHSFDPVNARYIRVEGIERATTFGYSIFEFEVYEKLVAKSVITFELNGDKMVLTADDGSTTTLTKS